MKLTLALNERGNPSARLSEGGWVVGGGIAK
jgi:hypothetical protein